MATKPKKPPLTHFLCIPLVTASSAPQWQASLDRFIVDAIATSATNEEAPNSTPSDPIPPEITAGNGGSDHQQAHSQSPLRPVASEHAAAIGASSAAQNAVQNARASSSNSNDNSVLASRSHPMSIQHPGPGLPVKAIRPLHSLHLTLGVMSLRDRARVEEATGLLRELDVAGMLRNGNSDAQVKTSGNKENPLRLTMKSLRPMQSARSTSVLYAEPNESSGRLLPFCQALRQAFVDKDFVIDEGRDLKLHATIVNTLHAKPKGKKKAKKLPPGWGRAAKQIKPGASREEAVSTAETADPTDEEHAAESAASHADGSIDNGPAKEISSSGKLDGRWLIEKWKDQVWAEVELEKVAICEMGATADENGVVKYKEIAEVALC